MAAAAGGSNAQYLAIGAWSDGVVVPVAFELDESRWELGAFRMTNAQRYRENHATNVNFIGSTSVWSAYLPMR
jgi:hypothetical protein